MIFLHENANKFRGENIRPRAEVIVLKGGKILLGNHEERGYMIPGGGIAPSEFPEAAARRECREEISTICKIVKLLGKKTYTWPTLYMGIPPENLDENHRNWLERNSIKQEVVYTYLAEYVSPVSAETGPADDKYEPIEVTMKQFRDFFKEKEATVEWQKKRKSDLMGYLEDIEAYLGITINEDNEIDQMFQQAGFNVNRPGEVSTGRIITTAELLAGRKFTEEELKKVKEETYKTNQLGFTELRKKADPIDIDAAIAIANTLNTGHISLIEAVDLAEFEMGLEVELEHGTRYPALNVTNDDPELTIKIVLAHLAELPDYYTRLKKMEEEGLKALDEKLGKDSS